MKPTLRLRHFASAPSESWPTSVPATTTRPAVGRSIPAIRFSSVVLPDPDGSHQGEELALGHLQRDAVEHDDLLTVARVDLPDVFDVHRDSARR